MASFGAQLRREREKQGVTLEEISLTTKIGTRMLRALEDEHFDQLPGGIFNKGFIRAYARCLGIDEDQAVADYLAATGATLARKSDINEPTPILEPPPREVQPHASLPWGTFAVLLLLVALGFATWGVYSRESEKSTPEATASAANSPASSPAAAPQSFPPEAKTIETSDRSAMSPKPTEHPAAAKAAAVSSPTAPVSPSASSQVASHPQPSSANGALLLVITAREDSWLSVSVDGEIVTRAVLTAPAQKSVRAQNEIVVRAGNVGALDFEFDGKKLPTQGDYGEAKTLTFDAHGLQPSAPKNEDPLPDAAAQPQ